MTFLRMPLVTSSLSFFSSKSLHTMSTFVSPGILYEKSLNLILLRYDKCTKSKLEKSISRNKFSDAVDEMIYRIEKDKTKYTERKSIVKHSLGTIKRSMNFTYFLLRNSNNVKGEISLAFFS